MKNNLCCLIASIFWTSTLPAQRIETVYLNATDSTSNMYVAVIPETGKIDSFLFLLDGFGNAPKDVPVETDLPVVAAKNNILTIIPVLKTGPLYFGSDTASQESLKELVESIAEKFKLQGKDFYIGGFSIGGTCAVKYAELAVRESYPFKPKAVFAVDPPLDWQRFYNAAKRVVKLSRPGQVNGEVTYMISRIEKEMGGTPETALHNYHEQSPYSYSDTTQKAIRSLVSTPIMIISEPDIQWWIRERGYDYSYINITDHAAMINELQKLGNDQAVLVTTNNKGYRRPATTRHPHSWSIADPMQTINWLKSRK